MKTISSPLASKANKKSSVPSLRLALESRLLFDGAIMATANDVSQVTAEQKDTRADTRLPMDFDFKHLGLDRDPVGYKIPAEKTAGDTGVLSDGTPPSYANTTVSQLIVVDPRSADGQTLLDNPPQGSRVVVLDSHQDGFKQIAEQLGGWHEVSDLHIVPAIVNGVTMLGNMPLTAIDSASVASVLADWGDGLTDDAHVIFHGEHVATEARVLVNVNIMTGAQSSWVREVVVDDLANSAGLSGNADTAQHKAPTSVIFIDTSVKNPAAIVAAAPASADIVYLYANQDGLMQIANYLNGRTGIDNIQLVSHGDDGALYLGDGVVSNANLSSYSTQLAQIGQSLSANGDILLYGCDVAQTAYGHQFVSSFSALTGADVAASDDETGSATLGGDWQLEDSIGTIETNTIVASQWDGLLAVPVQTSVPQSGTYVEQQALPIKITSPTLAAITDADNNLASVKIVMNAAPNGAQETVAFSGTPIALDVDKASDVTVGATTFHVVYVAATRTFTITNNAGGTLPSGGDLNTFIRDISYANTSDNPTNGGSNLNRTFTFTSTDTTPGTSTAAVSTITLTAVNDGPSSVFPTSFTASEDVALPLTGLSVSDPDATGTNTMTVTLTLSTASGGPAALGTIAGAASAGVTIGGTATARTFTGTQDVLNAYFAANNAPTHRH